MSSSSMSIYNHKHLQPAGASTQPPSQSAQSAHARLNDAFDIIKQEFDSLAGEMQHLRGQRDDFESKVSGQINELNIIRQSLYELETQHSKIRQQYEDEIRALRQENSTLRQQAQLAQGGPIPPPTREGIASLGRERAERDREREQRERERAERDLLAGPPPGSGPRERDILGGVGIGPGLGPGGPRGEASGRDVLGLGRPGGLGGPGGPPPPPPPSGPGGPSSSGVGSGGSAASSSAIGGPGIGPGGPGAPGGTSYGEGFYGRGAPPPPLSASQQGGPGRDRDRDGGSFRERDLRRERERDFPDPRGLSDRDRERLERERDLRDVRDARERDVRDRVERERGGPSNERDRDRDVTMREPDRERDARDVKRIKTEGRGKLERPDQYSPSLGPISAQQTQHQSISLGPPPSSSSNAPPPPGSVSNQGPPTQGPGGPPATPSNSNATIPGNGAPQTPSNGPGATPKLPPAPGPPYPSSAAGPSTSTSAPPGPPPPTPGGSNQPGAPGSQKPGGGQGPPPEVIDLAVDPSLVPPELKKEGSDWFAVFNPNTSEKGGKEGKRLDVNLVHTLLHESVVCCVRFSADGKFLATGCNRTAQIYDTTSGEKTCVLVDDEASKTGDLYIRSVCFSPDGKYLATGAEDKQIRIWDIAKRKIRNVFDGHQQEIYSLDFSRDGRLIVSGSGDRTARIWDMNDGSTNKILQIQEPDSIDAGVTSVCISPDGRLVAAGSLDTVVRIWDVQSGNLIERLRGHKDSVYSVAFTPDGRGLVSGSLDKTLKYWDVRPILANLGLGGGRSGPAAIGGANGVGGSKSGGPVGQQQIGPGVQGPGKDTGKGIQSVMDFVGHKDYVLSVAVSHDGQWVVSGSKDRGVQFWDAKTATPQCMLQGHKNSVISIDLSPAASLLATGSGDWQARIWSYTAL
ncbi:hypothetical protein ABKN59_010289 [Abortiporus biennis]